ncbi:hypothetical protein [Plastoroseomonas arctica]|uniref:Uncharacterized protein n=1 Tax=Plastoroseomonas arctica TaxID=1509237 RepID=A0AAF1JX05_9PROT|nr:hypothetical protein [Plastoroseomonas arctica]MBR0653664.1 hypothetical protein [Plastoroseomonas arctica]
MKTTYRCPDGREVVLFLKEDTLRVDASTREGERIGSFQFALVGRDGKVIDLMDDIGETGDAVSIKLAEGNLDEGWRHEGITERVMNLVADEISVSPKFELPKG